MKFNIAVTTGWGLDKDDYDKLIKLGFKRPEEPFSEYEVEDEYDGGPVEIEIDTLERLIELARDNGGSVILQTDYYDDSDDLRIEIYNSWRE